MKGTDNRQNKWFQTRRGEIPTHTPAASHSNDPLAPHSPAAHHGGSLLALVSNLLMATRIAQAAKLFHLNIHNYDRAQPLLDHAVQKKPALVLIDWDTCEAEAFKLLKSFSENADLKGVPVLGYVSQSKGPLKGEAQRAGCLHVYGKTEFNRDLNEIIGRYAP